MKCSVVVILALLLLFSSTCQTKDSGGTALQVEDTITALEDILGWAKSHYYLLITDFLFSIRVAQGKTIIPEAPSWSSQYLESIYSFVAWFDLISVRSAIFFWFYYLFGHLINEQKDSIL